MNVQQLIHFGLSIRHIRVYEVLYYLCTSHHNYTTSPAKIIALKVRSTIRKRAIESRNAPALIIAKAIAKLNPAAIAQLPPLDSMKRTIRGERKIELGAPANSNNTLELDIPDSYKVAKRGELFLLFDSGLSKKQILMFTILITRATSKS